MRVCDDCDGEVTEEISLYIRNPHANLALDVIEDLYRANDLHVWKGRADESGQRLEFQRKAMTNLRLLGYFAMLATEQNYILPKQFERISFLSIACMNLLGAWMNSDKKRFGL